MRFASFKIDRVSSNYFLKSAFFCMNWKSEGELDNGIKKMSQLEGVGSTGQSATVKKKRLTQKWQMLNMFLRAVKKVKENGVHVRQLGDRLG